MRCTPLVLASLASLATAGPVLNTRQTSTNTPEQIEADKLENIIRACLDKVDNVFENCETVLGRPRAECLDESEAETDRCMALTLTSPVKEPETTLDQHVQKHCGRAGNDKDACLFAARRCTAQVSKDVKAPEFLECVDIMQVCADQGALGKLDQCIDNARDCNAREKASLGELTKLGQCAKKNL